MVREYKVHRLLSWEEIEKFKKVRGVTKVSSQWLPSVGNYVTLEGTAKGIAKATSLLKQTRVVFAKSGFST